MLEQIHELLSHLSLLSLIAIAFAVILFVPPLCARVGLPAAVGLLLAGVAFGPNGLHITKEGMPVLTFLAEVGKLLIMFFAGLEIDLAQAKRTGGHSLLFGSLTCLLPLAAGTSVGLTFGYSWVSSLLIGSLLASHTLIGYPIVQRLGLGGKRIVAVTVGATVLTDIASLMVLAVCLPIHTSGFSTGSFAMQIIELAIYVPVVVFGLSAVGKWLFRRKGYTNEYQVGYTQMEGLLMWSLSVPQVAATLAAAVVAYNAKNAAGVRLIDEPVINTVVVLMVATSILGPMLTERFGRTLAGREQ